MPRVAHPYENLADLLEHLGDIDPRRIHTNPAPGCATEKDVLRLLNRENRLFELVDGTLVEKTMGMKEAMLAMFLGKRVKDFADLHDLGDVAGADGTLKLMNKLIRIPDVAFFSWDRLPNREYPAEPIPDLTPDLAVEVLSPNNTLKEIERKLKEYFLSGTQLVWVVDPDARTVKAHTAPDQFEILSEADTLTGGDVLPGFALPLKQLFARVPRVKPPRRKRKGA